MVPSCAVGMHAALIPTREAQATSWPRRPMSNRRRQPLYRPAQPEQHCRCARRSLPLRQFPARATVPSRGFFFSSEVQCLDVVSTESRSPALRAVSLAACGPSTITASSVRSSTLPCAIAADAASTAPFHWRSTLRRSITYIPCRRGDLIRRAISLPHVRPAIGSRATCYLTSSSDDTHGRAPTSFATPARCTARSSAMLGAP